MRAHESAEAVAEGVASCENGLAREVPPQVLGQLVSRAVPALGLLVKGFQDDGVEVALEPSRGPHLARRRGSA